MSHEVLFAHAFVVLVAALLGLGACRALFRDGIRVTAFLGAAIILAALAMSVYAVVTQ